jgi:SIR2-like domain
VFTTNYDELIEDTFLALGQPLRVSASEREFLAHRSDESQTHLIKLHGSINRPDTVVLTRSDFARSRSDRKEMFASLRNELADCSFLFVGFSLSDPNFGLLYDDIRLVYGMNIPVSYTVQGRRDPVKQRYLTSMDVNTIWLDGWNDLPDFLTRIGPEF